MCCKIQAVISRLFKLMLKKKLLLEQVRYGFFLTGTFSTFVIRQLSFYKHMCLEKTC